MYNSLSMKNFNIKLEHLPHQHHYTVAQPLGPNYMDKVESI